MSNGETKKSEAAQAAAAGRRDFLKLAALAAPAAVLASTGEAAAGEAPLPEGAAGYRKTEHVKQYLETARF